MEDREIRPAEEVMVVVERRSVGFQIFRVSDIR